MADAILALPVAAKRPDVAHDTVHTVALTGKLRAFGLRGPWRFGRANIEAWIAPQEAAARGDEKTDGQD